MKHSLLNKVPVFGVLDTLEGKRIWGISEATLTQNTDMCVTVNKASGWSDKPDDSWSDPCDPECPCAEKTDQNTQYEFENL